ncbi:Auxin response factor 3 [Hordeum vulgare]|nr:Auxin response factor 3 [Hordeum vulgare]
MENAPNLFDRMLAAEDKANRAFKEGLIFEGMPDPLMKDQFGLGNSFLLNHEFSEDYDLDEEDDEVDIDGEPLFDELPAQANAKSNKRKSFEFDNATKFKPYQMESKHGRVSAGKRRRVMQQEYNKFCSTLESIETHPVSGIGMKDMLLQALKTFKVHCEGKSINLTHSWMIINGEEKFKAQYAAIKVREEKETGEEHGEEEKSRSHGKTNSKKKDKREATSLTLQATLQGTTANKDSRKEKCRQDMEEQIRAFMKIPNKKQA